MFVMACVSVFSIAASAVQLLIAGQERHGGKILILSVFLAWFVIDSFRHRAFLQGVIDQHNLCHDLHGTVDAEGFAKGCVSEQKRVYGRSPHEETVARLEAALDTIATRAAQQSGDFPGASDIVRIAQAALAREKKQ